MPKLALLIFVAGLADGPSTVPPGPERATAQRETTTDAQTLDEVVITAPRRRPEPQYSVAVGSGAREFDAEVSRKEQMRRYRDTGSLKDYPGLRCAVFHRC